MIDLQQKLNSNSPIVQALRLWDAGLNLFPLTYGHKDTKSPDGRAIHPLKWGLYHTRPNRDSLSWLFYGQCNIAVVMGRSSGNLFVIDADTDEAFRHHLFEVTNRGIPLFAAKSARGGHIYLKCADGEVKNAKMRDGDIKGDSHSYVVAPPSLHPSGEFYRWVSNCADDVPVVDAADIDWLVDADGKPMVLSTKRMYADGTEDYIKNGAVEGERNNRLYAAAHDMAWRGNTESDIKRKIIPIAEATGLGRDEVVNTIESGIRNGQSRAGGAGSSRLSERHQAIEAFINGAVWRGRTGTTDKAVMSALLERSKRDARGKNSFRASLRELSDLAQITPKTVGRSVDRLIAAGYIEHSGYNNSGSSLWIFSDVVITEGKNFLGYDHSNPKGLQLHSTVVITEKNLAQGLGKVAAQVYMAMRGKGYVSVAELVEMTGLSQGQVYASVRKMRDKGLASKEKTTYALVDYAPQLAAIKAEGQVKIEKRQLKFEKERQARAEKKIIRFRERVDGGFAAVRGVGD